MKKLFAFLIFCFAGMVMSAEQMHWTPVDEGLYSGSTAVIAVVKVNGVEQASAQMELAAFCGDECRGTAMTSEFSVTHRFLALLNVYGEVGDQLTFKAYDHATNQEMEPDPAVTVTFTEDGSGSLFEPLELNFAASNPEPVLHWTPVDEGLYSGSTAVIAVVKVNGVEQCSPDMELAAFCENECRGTIFTTEFPATHRFLALLNVYGENGDELTFKAYDHATNQELENDPVVTVTFSDNGSGTLFAPLELNFGGESTITQTTDLEEGWNWFSTFIAIDDPEEGLVMIEEALGEYGLQIKYLDDFTDFDGEEWFGGLEEATNDLMYMIQVSEDCTITIQGLPVNTEEVEITLEPGWNWIGFPSSEVLSIEDAFAGFEPAEGDQIKSIDDYTDFDGEEWFGDLEELTPGVGFMYLNTSDETKTLVFQTDKK